MGQADLVIGPWGDKGMDNIIYLRPGTTVLELFGENAHEEELKSARVEAECLELAYDQVHRCHTSHEDSSTLSMYGIEGYTPFNT